MTKMKTYSFPVEHNMYIVTVKLHKNPAHDPRNKIVSDCRMSHTCTDATGEHHSYLTTGRSVEEVTQAAKDAWGHVTRVEEV
jgi:hypothetical protein